MRTFDEAVRVVLGDAATDLSEAEERSRVLCTRYGFAIDAFSNDRLRDSIAATMITLLCAAAGLSNPITGDAESFEDVMLGVIGSWINVGVAIGMEMEKEEIG